jgi:hypothetical protein
MTPVVPSLRGIAIVTDEGDTIALRRWRDYKKRKHSER